MLIYSIVVTQFIFLEAYHELPFQQHVQVVFKHHGQFGETGTTWVTRVMEIFAHSNFTGLRELFCVYNDHMVAVSTWCESWFIFCPEELLLAARRLKFTFSVDNIPFPFDCVRIGHKCSFHAAYLLITS